jgi:hypothetical protein
VTSDAVSPGAEPRPEGPPAWIAAGPPAWALGAALVVSGNIFAYWAVRVPGAGPTVVLALVGLVLRLVGLGLLVRWALPIRAWWAYVLAAVCAAGMISAVLEALDHIL